MFVSLAPAVDRVVPRVNPSSGVSADCFADPLTNPQDEQYFNLLYAGLTGKNYN